MKVLLINSVKYGTKEVLLDDEDFAVVNKWSWGLCTSEKDHTFYAHRTERGTRKTIRMHRLIMGITDSKTLVDHKDRNGLNNQKDNLRICTYSQNGCNRKISSNKSSKFIGEFANLNVIS